MKKVLYAFVLGISFLAIPVLLFGIVNTMVSQKYETDYPQDCISVISGDDLCLEIKIMKGLVAFSVLVITLLLVYRKRILK